MTGFASPWQGLPHPALNFSVPINTPGWKETLTVRVYLSEPRPLDPPVRVLTLKAPIFHKTMSIFNSNFLCQLLLVIDESQYNFSIAHLRNAVPDFKAIFPISAFLVFHELV